MGAKYCGRFSNDAEALAGSVRAPTSRLVDPCQVAERLGVRVRPGRLSGGVEGWTVSSKEVVLSRSLRGNARRYVLAHELGHVLVSRGELEFRCRRSEECFADAFARELLVPAAALDEASMDARASLARRFQVASFVVALQLATVGAAPALMRDRSGRTLCVTCGHRASISRCQCLRYRQNPRLPAATI